MQIEKIFSEKGQIIEGPLLIKPKVYIDKRGNFFESWNNKTFEKFICSEINFVQDNESNSSKGVLRGLHFQLEPQSQCKLVRATRGEIFDVIVDLRKSSKTFLNWYGIQLSEENKMQLWIPKGFAHGFLTISNKAKVEYKVSNYWSKEFERSLLWNDLNIGINWPIKKLNLEKPFISEKDYGAFLIHDLIKKKEIFE